MAIIMRSLAVASTAFSGLYLSVGGYSLNAERAYFLLILLLGSIIIVYNSTYKKSTYKTVKYSSLYLVWLLVLSISTFSTDNVSAHIPGLVICAIPVFMYYFFSTTSNIEKSLHYVHVPILIYLGVGGVAVFFIEMVIDRQLVINFVGNLSNPYSVKLTTVEPNIFGSTISFFLILHFYKFEKRLLNYVIYISAIASLFFSFSRGPYLGFAIGTLLYLSMTGYFKTKKFGFHAYVLLILSGIGIFYGNQYISNIYESQINRSGTIGTRMVVLGAAIQNIIDNPIAGNGALDFPISTGSKIMGLVGANEAHQVSIWQMFVGITHDSGFLGLFIYLFFILNVLYHGYRATKKTDGVEKKRRISYLCAFISILVSGQITTTYYTAIFGIALGILGSRWVPAKQKQKLT